MKFIFCIFFSMLLSVFFIVSVMSVSVGTGSDVQNLVILNCPTNINCDDGNLSTEDICINPKTYESYCENKPITCFINSDCGADKTIGDLFCQIDGLYQNYQSFTCSNPATSESYCSSEINPVLINECVVGCSEGKCIEDITPPEAVIKYNPEINDIEILGTDSQDNDVEVTCVDSSSSFSFLKKSKTCALEDNSGNTLTINLKYKKGKNSVWTKIVDLTYSDEKIISLKQNSFESSNNKKSIKQNISTKNKFNIITDYNKNNDRTAIKIQEGRTTRKYTEEGLILFNIATDNGTLRYD